MSERDHRKAMLRERIRNDRDVIGLEVENVRARVSSASKLLAIGRDLIGPVGTFAGVTAAAAARGGKAVKNHPKGAATAAAIIPVVLAVAKIVASISRHRSEARKKSKAEQESDEQS